MSKAIKTIIYGLIQIVIGAALKLFTEDVDIPKVIELPKVGVVLLVIGAIELAYGVYLLFRGPSAKRL